MNTKNNLRYTTTQKLIIDTFMELLKEKEFKKISVSEVCNRAHVNRATFYLHFLDIYDLMEKTEEAISDEMVSLFTSRHHGTIGDSFLDLFYHIQKNKGFYQGYVAHGGENKLLRILLSEDLFEKQVKKSTELGYLKERERVFHEEFFKAGLSAMIVLWLASDCLESPEEMIEIIAREYHPNKELFIYGSS